MNARSTVLQLYTASFPYGKGESVLENEILVLSKKFEKIYIHPKSSKAGDKRTVPDNVIVLDAINDRSNLNSFGIFFKNFGSILWILWSEFIHCNNKFYFIKKIRSFNSLLIRAFYDAACIKQLSGFSDKKHVHYSFWMNDWALALSVLKYKKDINRFIFRCGGFDIYDERHEGNYLPFRFFIYKNTSAIYPNSLFGTNYIKKKQCFEDKVQLQYWGTNDYGLNPFASQGMFTIVSCSNLIPLKRVHLIIEILKQLKFEFKWVHFGDGFLMNDLKEKAKSLPDSAHFEFRGSVSNQEILNFYKKNSVNLFITTSETESLPVSIQEAISFGIPCVATNVGGISEIVNDTTGALIEKDFDIKAVAAIVDGFYSGNKNTPEYRKGVRQFWLDHFSAEVNYNAFYNEIVQRTRS
ncbi:MAG: glycosyltransferase [Bacteroidetes bacterium]|nr:glycosyltransferase [Bacteroidota bacterium]